MEITNLNINMKLSRTDNSLFSHDFEKEKSHENKIARTEESESPMDTTWESCKRQCYEMLLHQTMC